MTNRINLNSIFWGSILTLEGFPINGVLKVIGNDPINDPDGLSLTTEASISVRSCGVPNGDHRQWLLGTNINYPTVDRGSFGISTASLSATPFVIRPTDNPAINFVGINNPKPTESLDVIGNIKIENGNILFKGPTQITTIAPSASMSTWTLTLPVNEGTNGYILTTDGTGTTSWENIGNATAGAKTPLDVIGHTQGDIIYRGPSSWNELLPGILGQALTTRGPAANPYWSTVATWAGSAPASSTSAGSIGQYFADNTYAYFCIAPDTWVKVAVIPSF